jgi:hypothetical protein
LRPLAREASDLQRALDALAACLPLPPRMVVLSGGRLVSEHHRHVQTDVIVSRGMQVLIAPDAGKRKGTRPGWDGGLYAFMRRVLDTDRGGGLYAKRQGKIEPVFRHQVQPPLRPLPTPRQIRGPVGMAADRRNAQPAQALAPDHGPDGRLSRGRPGAARASGQALPAQPVTRGASATFRDSLRRKQESFVPPVVSIPRAYLVVGS